MVFILQEDYEKKEQKVQGEKYCIIYWCVKFQMIQSHRSNAQIFFFGAFFFLRYLTVKIVYPFSLVLDFY